ncbi:hypothetical protein XELAEV_18043097mg [Xenopus laevis]|uniref:Uncharacterized protein n=1 Tax=Xenopus laevis TaxID=8355 RepID=A0A974H237_XENLA|nr:hypothetical protein XELAEV_18043097mg [Xenopus laevis]
MATSVASIKLLGPVIAHIAQAWETTVPYVLCLTLTLSHLHSHTYTLTLTLSHLQTHTHTALCAGDNLRLQHLPVPFVLTIYSANVVFVPLGSSHLPVHSKKYWQCMKISCK